MGPGPHLSGLFIRIFNQDAQLLASGVPAMRIYYFGFCFMSLQFAGQSVFVALGKAKRAVFFSILRESGDRDPADLSHSRHFRKRDGRNLHGRAYFQALAGGGACFITMLLTLWPELREKRTR